MKWIISCKEATNYISIKEEGRLSLRRRIQLQLHLGICSLCRLFYRQSKIIAHNTAQLEEQLDSTLSPTDKQRMIDRLREDS